MKTRGEMKRNGAKNGLFVSPNKRKPSEKAPVFFESKKIS
jgi:hypothetical protein